MRKYQIHYLTDYSCTAAPEALEHVATFMEGVTIDSGFMTGSNDRIGVHDHVTVIYVPENYFINNISTNSFLMEVFDYFTTHVGNVGLLPDELIIHPHRARHVSPQYGE